MAAPAKPGVTVVTQTQVQSGKENAFADWQAKVVDVVAGFPGFVSQTVIRPSPPAQIDWVVLQRFGDSSAALAWLRSERRERLVGEVRPILVGINDVHLVHDSGQDVGAAP